MLVDACCAYDVSKRQTPEMVEKARIGFAMACVFVCNCVKLSLCSCVLLLVFRTGQADRSAAHQVHFCTIKKASMSKFRLIYSRPRNLAGKLLNEPGMPPRECIVVRVQQEASRLWNRLSWKFSWDNNSTISIQQFIKQTICHAKLQKQLGSSGRVAHVLRWFLRLWVGDVGTIMARSQKQSGIRNFWNARIYSVA